MFVTYKLLRRLCQVGLTTAVVLLAARSASGAEPIGNVHQLYVLSFNEWGELLNPGEKDLAREQLRLDKSVQRIIVVSYGWANDGQASYATYRRLVEELTANTPDNLEPRNVAVIAVGWDSSQSGFRKILTDLIPLPGVGEALAYIPDRVLFPITFWSKAAHADRIGFGGLRTALNEVFSAYESEEEFPELYLLGHSFGTRIVSGLVQEEIANIRVGATSFDYADKVTGMILLQPALVLENLYEEADYPVMATMSQHDHAVGFLYPVANIPLNSLGFSAFEAFVQAQFLGRVQKGVQTASSTATHLINRDADYNGTKLTAATEEPEEGPSVVSRGLRRGWRTLGEVLALPLNLIFTAVVTPLDYLYIQTRGFVTHPISHVMDSLAQIPLIEIPVESLSRMLGHEYLWGQRSKGVFGLGPIHEGVGRLVSPRLFRPNNIRVYSLADLNELDSPPTGVFVVDATPIVRTGAFGLDLANPWVNYTIGWIDPIGAHGDYRNRDVVALMSWMANGTPVPVQELRTELLGTGTTAPE